MKKRIGGNDEKRVSEMGKKRKKKTKKDILHEGKKYEKKEKKKGAINNR